MFKTFRIVCCIIAAAFVAAVMPVGTLISWTAAIICAMCAFLFFGLTLIFKQKQEEKEAPPPSPQGDFFNPVQKQDGAEPPLNEDGSGADGAKSSGADSANN